MLGVLGYQYFYEIVYDNFIQITMKRYFTGSVIMGFILYP